MLDPNSDTIHIAKTALKIESQALLSLSEKLPPDFISLVDSIIDSNGRVIIAGVGKSGHIGRKISATLTSTGTPSYFIHPSEASHGDMGMLMVEDICILISNSGETYELRDLLNYIKRFNIKMAAICSEPDSTLSKAADFSLILPKEPEVCSIGMAPTTSTIMMLGLGDALAVSLMHRRNFDAEQFQIFHPGGKLGAQMVKVEDLMHGIDKMPIVTIDMPMREALLEMSSKGFGYAVVLEAQKVIGVISDGDIRRHIDDLLEKTVGEVATRNPITISSDIFASEALSIMNSHKIGVLVVTDKNNFPKGIFHIQDLLRAGVA
ncbi:MAG: KpsF/GutQ family sugar-phosphate isomerase [Rhodobacteraceae bacterium]|nr:KpsF/GutQ family sugar-phosphate isomerase [Paracoccaceae bacterium]|tara:strand:+ start:2143 stop:3105 length:963 start_codon:yes stop_codon:yes gene_type:complete